MLTLKSEASEDLASLNFPSATKELEHWERVVFAFDMDREQPSNSRNPRRSRSASSATNATGQQQPLDTGGVNVQDAALLAQFAAAAAGTGDLDPAYSNMLSQGAYPSMAPSPGFYGNFQHHTSMAPPQLPPLSSLDFPWHPFPPQQPQAGPSHYDPHHTNPTTGILPFLDPHYGAPPASEASGSNTRRGQSSQSPAGAHASSSPDAEPAEGDGQLMTDEKRRRNTAASARFRIKKKHRTITLERSVSDLTGRAEELEREVTDLRRENGWLKEIVMLKGTQFAVNSVAHRQALSQAAALATGGQSSTQHAESGPSASGSGMPSESVSESSSESSDHDGKAPDKKGKGTKKGKGKQPAKGGKKL